LQQILEVWIVRCSRCESSMAP